MSVDTMLFWILLVLVFIFSALATYHWPREDPPFIIFEGEEELQQMCWEGLHNQRHR